MRATAVAEASVNNCTGVAPPARQPVSNLPNLLVMTMQFPNRHIGALAIVFLMPILASCVSHPSTATVVWDSGELQTQIGDKNKNKKKLVMRFWQDYLQKSNGTYDWAIRYSIRAENHNLVGSGWHTVSELYSIAFTVVVHTPQGNATVTNSINLIGVDSKEDAYYFNTSTLPTTVSKTVTGSRYGGSSGISITWP